MQRKAKVQARRQAGGSSKARRAAKVPVKAQKAVKAQKEEVRRLEAVLGRREDKVADAKRKLSAAKAQR